LLTQRNLNHFQRWALRYAIYMNRRIQLQDAEDMLQRQTWYLEPGRYQDLFLAGHFDAEPLTVAGKDLEEVAVDEVDELDRYFAQLEEKRTMTGAMVLDTLNETQGGWV
jgi:hypothetical protein